MYNYLFRFELADYFCSKTYYGREAGPRTPQHLTWSYLRQFYTAKSRQLLWGSASILVMANFLDQSLKINGD